MVLLERASVQTASGIHEFVPAERTVLLQSAVSYEAEDRCV